MHDFWSSFELLGKSFFSSRGSASQKLPSVCMLTRVAQYNRYMETCNPACTTLHENSDHKPRTKVNLA